MNLVARNRLDRHRENRRGLCLNQPHGPFNGLDRRNAQDQCSFYRGELSQFASDIEKLYKDLVGVAQLTPIERHLELRFTGDGKGHILVEGKAQHRLSAGTYLKFTMELDQTELPAIANAL